MKALRALLSRVSPADAIATARALLTQTAQQDILATVTHCLLVYDGHLLNPRSGEYRSLASTEGPVFAEAVAAAARQLLPGSKPGEGVLLLLPSAQFIATRYQLALGSASLLRSALSLQAHTLIPAYDQALLLAVDATRSDGVALWYPAGQAAALFPAFEAQGLLLAALLPRAFALLPDARHRQDLVITDEDATHCVQLEWRAGSVRAWLVVARHDLADPAFAEQWQTETARATATQRLAARGWDDWSSRRLQVQPPETWCFFPSGALRHGHRLWQRKQRRAAGRVAAAALLLALLPFLRNVVELAWLDHKLAELREQSTEARESQATVLALEDEWGVVADYPRQDVARVLLTLNQYINSSLTDFTLDRGVVDLVGYAQDPALLVEQLAEGEVFYDVSQSRSSSGGDGGLRGDRFGIRLRLNGVDFEDYEARYPVVEGEGRP